MQVTVADWLPSVASPDRGWCKTLYLRHNICNDSLRA